ncbi:MAG: class I SAM-dependent methyltransferase [Crocinitomicaceae bacterium]|tara:strand:- start:9 stop:1232 length:1224 start_codon:yes stop_codon:yes gene_type:complete
MNCRFCNEENLEEFIDLNNAPASNSYLKSLTTVEPYYPLKVFTCPNCKLVQIDEVKSSAAIFDENYAYFSSYSKSWLVHCKNYVEKVTKRFDLNVDTQVVEIASNDGYLLQYFLEKSIPVLGVEPTANTAKIAQEKGINTLTEFFTTAQAEIMKNDGISPKLLLGNNVLAHVPDINDFVGGMKILLAYDGIITIEFPHLCELISNNQFDTIYHEHYSYLSFTFVQRLFSKYDLELFDVEEISTHGGSLRIYAKHSSYAGLIVEDSVKKLLDKELRLGINSNSYYREFQPKAEYIKIQLLDFLVTAKKEGKMVAAYGAAAKGNTLLNYCGIKKDLIEFVVDANPHKQNNFMPGSHIPIVDDSYLHSKKPDFVLILPWNLTEEITESFAYIKDWGGKFLTAIPGLTIID